MKKKHIVNAIKGRISTVSNTVGINYPNVNNASLTVPYYDVLPIVSERTGGTLKGNEVKRDVCRQVVNVVIEYDTRSQDGQFRTGGEDYANDLADDLADLFPEGLKLPITGGNIVITAPPDIRAGFRDGSEWRVPVMIPFLATST